MSAKTEKIPGHIAIIMDGNGRWAQKHGLPRLKGHEAGVATVRRVVRLCRDHGVKYVTLYAFSTENWLRPPAEILGLMTLLKKFLLETEPEMHADQVRLRVIGQREKLEASVERELRRVEKATEKYDRNHLILALSYGGRAELVQAMQQIAAQVARGEMKPEKIDEADISAHLYAPDVPDPDLIIRTSGEMRLSNFLLWQASYSELYATPVLWPDFGEEDFRAALAAYAQRERRFGRVNSVTK
jgi:undecaprenyl diphosphate synthase